MPPLPVQQYGKGFEIMKEKGYDGISGLGINKNGMREPLMPPKIPKNLGLEFKPIMIYTPRTLVISSEGVSAFENVDISNESYIETNSHEWEYGFDKSLSDYDLEEHFEN